MRQLSVVKRLLDSPRNNRNRTIHDSFSHFIHKYTEKQKSIRREIKFVHWHFGSSIDKNLLCISYKKGGIEEIKSARIEFFY